MKTIYVAIWAGLASMGLAALGSSAMSLQMPDVPTTTACITSVECPVGQYCHPTARVCYFGVAITGGCNTAADCPAAPGVWCHDHRCHVGTTPCTSNAQCHSTEYCHYGLCHAEACNMDSDCPVGVQCINPLHVCALP